MKRNATTAQYSPLAGQPTSSAGPTLPLPSPRGSHATPHSPGLAQSRGPGARRLPQFLSLSASPSIPLPLSDWRLNPSGGRRRCAAVVRLGWARWTGGRRADGEAASAKPSGAASAARRRGGRGRIGRRPAPRLGASDGQSKSHLSSCLLHHSWV